MSTPASLSRLYLAGAMLCLLLAAMRYWLVPEAETGMARLMLRALLQGAAAMGAFSLGYGGGKTPRATGWGACWFWLALGGLGLLLFHIWAIEWAGWAWLYARSDPAWQAQMMQILGFFPRGIAVGWWLWGISQVGASLHWIGLKCSLVARRKG